MGDTLFENSFLMAISNAVSELTILKPNPVRPVCPTMKDLPDPGPPARKTALKMAGSLIPSSSSGMSTKSAKVFSIVRLFIMF